MKLYHSLEELNNERRQDSITIARKARYDVIQPEPNDHTLCGKHGTDEIIHVFPDGSWELTDKRLSGTSATDLKIFNKLGEEQYRSYSQ